MSNQDQCPSSKKNGLPADKPAAAPDRSASTGKVLWRSMDELAGTREFKDFLHREFPAYASELLDGSRRHFLRIMGASVALAGAATLPGCRRPDHKILAYHKDPETVIPGKPLYYATAMPMPGGGQEGLLAETYEGRPTKLEGNPLHPLNMGKSSVRSQAAILDLYDPDRDPREIAKHAGDGKGVTSWAAFAGMAGTHFGAYDATNGRKLAFLVEKSSSPSRDRLREQVLRRWPRAKWYVYEPIDDENAIEGSRLAFGEAYRTIPSFDKASVVVSLDSDFLGADGSIAEARAFAAGRYRDGARRGREASGSTMNRLYVIESNTTLTGGQADHRLPLKPSDVGAFAYRLAAEVAKLLPRGVDASGHLRRIVDASGKGEGFAEHATWVQALAKDLVGMDAHGQPTNANIGKSVIVAGPSQSAAVHALVHAMNAALGNAGNTVRYAPLEGDAGESSLRSITDLCGDIDAGEVGTLVVIGSNPVYSAPSDLDFASKYAKVGQSIYLGSWDETAAASTIFLLRSHFLESWSDSIGVDGTYSVTQPMIAPLYDSHTELELLGTILGGASADGYGIVQETLRVRTGASGFEKAWRRTLHDGVLAGSVGSAARSAPTVRWAQIADGAASAPAVGGGIEVVFAPCPHIHDGRYANNGWLQELPHPITKISWDNPALISRATAKRLGIPLKRHPKTPQYNHGQIVDISVGGRTVRMPVWVQPGLADDTVIVTLGYGRAICGRIGSGTGFNAYPLRTSGSMRIAGGAEVSVVRRERPYLLANTQDHWAMEGRAPIREVDLAAWQKHGDTDFSDDLSVQKDAYGRMRGLNFAGLLGIESHTPSNENVYRNRQQHFYTELNENGRPKLDSEGRVIGKLNKYGRRVQQWGMSIDLTKCTGCGACTIACQAENNIPIVGKMEVAKGREMHWIRVDRYYASTVTEDAYGVEPAEDPNPDILVQPIPCMQCENAPCEVVCPVNATTHSPEGLNDMAYNRCIGTRYCSNNCPYKVRRFNYFDYGTKSFAGGFGQLAEGVPDSLMPSNRAFVPPRLREPKPKVERMQSNPHVSVRSRGVMEKCTYCVQRINQARVETKLEDLGFIPDGYVQTACQQACPSDAIVFGDIYDYESNDGAGSRVSRLHTHNRTYGLLAYLNARPRTTFLLRLRNPNPLIRKPNADPFHHGPHGADSHSNGDGHHAAGRLMSLPILNQAGALA